MDPFLPTRHPRSVPGEGLPLHTPTPGQGDRKGLITGAWEGP